MPLVVSVCSVCIFFIYILYVYVFYSHLPSPWSRPSLWEKAKMMMMMLSIPILGLSVLGLPVSGAPISGHLGGRLLSPF